MKRYFFPLPVVALTGLFIAGCGDSGVSGLTGSGAAGQDAQLTTNSVTGIISNVPTVDNVSDVGRGHLEGVIVLDDSRSFAITDLTEIRAFDGTLMGIEGLEVGQNVEVQFERGNTRLNDDGPLQVAQSTATNVQLVQD